ncbi:alpha-L-fucosidase [Nonomuraea sp. NPDC059023]|uniref:alpha-L-fucosidase n=1 Tax=unclassified Nonomuraea TaxID=2593643 RepID=UPI00367AA1FA
MNSHHTAARTTPAWFDEAKLGIFIHWNPAVVPAYAPVPSVHPVDEMMAYDESGVQAMRRNPYADMYWNSMNIPGSPTARHHAEHYPGLDYDDFVRVFREQVLSAFDPRPWAELFARAGARYVVLTTKMDDGFLLWPSATPNPHRKDWQSTRDVVGDLAEAVRERGLRFATYYCGGQDWTFTGLPLADIEAFMNGCPPGPAYAAYADAHIRELTDRYQPSVLWNDYSYPADSDVPALFRHYWDTVPDGLVNNRFAPPGTDPGNDTSGIHYDFLTPEQTTAGHFPGKWEACMTLGTAWGYNRMEPASTHLSGEQLIRTFIDVVARGGNLLINVGPTAAATIPWMQAEPLLALGWWLETNGEAIYATRPWTKTKGLTGEALDIRYTQSNHPSGGAVHAIVLGTPTRRDVELDVRLDGGARVSLTGHGAALPWEETPMGVRIQLPDQLDPRPAHSLRLEPANHVHPHTET